MTSRFDSVPPPSDSDPRPIAYAHDDRPEAPPDWRDAEIARLRARVTALETAGKALLASLPRCSLNEHGDIATTDDDCCPNRANHLEARECPVARGGVPACESCRVMWIPNSDFPTDGPARALEMLLEKPHG